MIRKIKMENHTSQILMDLATEENLPVEISISTRKMGMVEVMIEFSETDNRTIENTLNRAFKMNQFPPIK